MSNPIYAAALDALALGWSVMPTTREKVPLVKWKQFQTELPNEDRLKLWFERYNDRNLGLITGELSGRIVLETDSQDALDYAISRGLPPGPVAQSSQSFKRHFHFKHPGFTVPNSASKIFPGVDVRGDGGYAQLPPSVHKSGVQYEWIVGPHDVELPVMPDWLLDEVKVTPFVPSEVPVAILDLDKHSSRLQKYAAAAYNGELQAVATAPDGAKHAQLFKSVARVAGFIPHGFYSESEVKSAFFDAVAGRAQDKKGAEKTIADAIKKGMSNPVRLPEDEGPSRKVILRGGAARRYALGASAQEASQSSEDKPGADEEERVVNNGLYAIQNGRTYLCIVKSEGRGADKKEVEEFSPVVDLAATITQEFREESGKAIFGIEGRTVNGRKITFEIPASKMTDPKAVAEALSNIADAGCVFYAGKEKHLGPAIKSFSSMDEVESWRRFNRTGWTQDGSEFIIPGIEAEDVSIKLPKKLAYNVVFPDKEQLARGGEAIKALLGAQKLEQTCVCLAHLLAPPMAFHCDWRGERSALFITGRTGSWKSAWAFVAMCLYGEEFADEDNVFKFGSGGMTNNSRVRFFTEAGDMPLLIDNYKPGNGKGEPELIELIHMALEGGDKERLNRNSEHQDSNPIHAWPFFTGEDSVHDAAAAARCLIVPFPLAPDDPRTIQRAQDLSPDLHFIGGALIEWLLTKDGRETCKAIRKEFVHFRQQWAQKLRAMRPDMVNIYRVASNLAVNECSWRCALSCPALASILRPYCEAHARGLEEIAASMGQHTAQSVEANRYMEAIRALLSSDRGYLCPRVEEPKVDERRLKLGWEDSEGVYLIPEVAYCEAVKLLRDSGALNNVSKATIHKQMAQLGYLEKQGKDEMPVGIYVGLIPKKTKVLFLKSEALYGSQEPE